MILSALTAVAAAGVVVCTVWGILRTWQEQPRSIMHRTPTYVCYPPSHSQHCKRVPCSDIYDWKDER